MNAKLPFLVSPEVAADILTRVQASKVVTELGIELGGVQRESTPSALDPSVGDPDYCRVLMIATVKDGRQFWVCTDIAREMENDPNAAAASASSEMVVRIERFLREQGLY